jgi:hypothetical protein
MNMKVNGHTIRRNDIWLTNDREVVIITDIAKVGISGEPTKYPIQGIVAISSLHFKGDDPAKRATVNQFYWTEEGRDCRGVDDPDWKNDWDLDRPLRAIEASYMAFSQCLNWEKAQLFDES